MPADPRPGTARRPDGNEDTDLELRFDVLFRALDALSRGAATPRPTVTVVSSGGGTSTPAWADVQNRPATGAVRTFTASAALTAADEHALVDASGGNLTLTLPSAAGDVGRTFTVIKTDASANTVTVDPAGTETINGGATAVITRQHTALTIISDGANWRVK